MAETPQQTGPIAVYGAGVLREFGVEYEVE